jgi:septal ring factor EnvC (AmiA/AmiB activator)
MLEIESNQKFIEIKIDGDIKQIPLNGLSAKVALRISDLSGIQKLIQGKMKRLNKAAESLHEKSKSLLESLEKEKSEAKKKSINLEIDSIEEEIEKVEIELIESNKKIFETIDNMFKYLIKDIEKYSEIFDLIPLNDYQLLLTEILAKVQENEIVEQEVKKKLTA